MVTVQKTTDEDRAAALRLLFAHQSELERRACVDQAIVAHETGEFSLEHLLVAREDSRIVGVCLLAIQPDRSGLLWPPVIHDRENDAAAESIVTQLLDESRRHLRDHHCWIGQCLVAVDDVTTRERFANNGFSFMTNLIFMRLGLPSKTASDAAIVPTIDSNLTTVTYLPGDNDEHFAGVIDQTYIETQDCPELRDVRTPRQALASHQLSGQFDPDLWKTYQHDGNDIGIVLLATHPAENYCELVYFGVCQSARGQGSGQQLLQHAIDDAVATGSKHLVLAVDDRNTSAKTIYQKFGFEFTSTNAVHAWFPRHGNENQ